MHTPHDGITETIKQRGAIPAHTSSDPSSILGGAYTHTDSVLTLLLCSVRGPFCGTEDDLYMRHLLGAEVELARATEKPFVDMWT